MVSTYTPNRGYELQGTGDNVDAWGPPLNADFTLIDKNLSASLAVSMSSSNVTLNSTQAQNLIFALSGTLLANVSLLYPQVGGFFIVDNQTTGNFTVSVFTTAGGSSGIRLTQGSRYLLYSDGTNIKTANDFTTVPTGTILDFGGSTAPPGFALCSGQALSRTTDAALFAVIGTTWGAGDGSTTFNVPDLRGRLKATLDNLGGSAAGRITFAGSGITSQTLGGSGGVQNITLTSSELPAFIPNSAVSSTTVFAPSGYQLMLNVSGNFLAYANGGALSPNAGGLTTALAGTTDTNVQVNPSGGAFHNNMPPVAMVTSMIKR